MKGHMNNLGNKAFRHCCPEMVEWLPSHKKTYKGTMFLVLLEIDVQAMSCSINQQELFEKPGLKE
jgi:hypothetical protein